MALITTNVQLSSGSVPGSPTEGQMYYDSTTKVIMVYNGSAWEQLSDQSTGGLVTTYSSGGNDYRVHTFLTSGTFTLTATKSLDYLIVGGGGGGMMNNISGGTGAGGMWVKTSDSQIAGSYPIVVGAGGSNTGGSGGHVSGARGHSSSAFGHAAAGGGAGRWRDDSDDNSSGASGGGGGSGWSPAHSNGSTGHGVVGSNGDTDSGTTFYGGDGGDGHGQGSHHANSGGGGGAGGNGGDANQDAGDAGRGGVGGAGLQNSFRTGSAQWYCAGGGGATYFGSVESGMMNGIGGSGVCEGSSSGYPPSGTTFSNASNSPHGVDHTGSGAGGIGQGGSGIVVIRYII